MISFTKVLFVYSVLFFVSDYTQADPDCTERLDIVIVIDGSGSVESQHFEDTKQFVAKLIDSFYGYDIETGFVVYSSHPDVIVPLASGLDNDHIRNMVLQAAYSGGGTDTASAILTVVDMFKMNGRDGSPKVMAFFTDGRSATDVTQAVDQTKAYGINTIAFGIGHQINPDELLLIAHNDPDHVYSFSSFDQMIQYFDKIRQVICATPTEPTPEPTTTSTPGTDSTTLKGKACICLFWLGDICGSRLDDSEILEGDCDPLGYYNCKSTGEAAVLKAFCAVCFHGERPGLDFCALK